MEIHDESRLKQEIASIAHTNWRLAASHARYLQKVALSDASRAEDARQAAAEADDLREKAKKAAAEAASAHRLACFTAKCREESKNLSPLDLMPKPLKPPVSVFND